MIIGVDVGGTKTLIARMDRATSTTALAPFPTPKDPSLALSEIISNIKQITDWKRASGIVIGVPGHIDAASRTLIACGNLPWKNLQIAKILEQELKLPVLIENDAKLAGLSEARQHGETSGTCLYLTVSTGIGAAVVYNGLLDKAVLESEVGHMLLQHEGQYVSWETFGSGRALYEKYDKKAAEIHDSETWREFIQQLIPGFLVLIPALQPDSIIIGGSIGTYFDRYGKILREELAHFFPATGVVELPRLLGAKHAEQAVINGCYEYGSDYFGRH